MHLCCAKKLLKETLWVFSVYSEVNDVWAFIRGTIVEAFILDWMVVPANACLHELVSSSSLPFELYFYA